MAASTRSSAMPRRRSWRSTMRSRASVDVVSEGVGVMHENLAAPGGDQPGALELGEEARRALPRGARELRDLGLGGLDQDRRAVVAGAVGLAEDRLPVEVAARHGHLGQLRQVAWRQAGEDGRPAEEAGDLLDAGHGPHDRSRRSVLEGRAGFTTPARTTLVPMRRMLVAAVVALATVPASAGAQSRDLWTTVNLCNTPAHPNQMGVRGRMPGDG